MTFIEIAGICINLEHVAYIRKEDHAQLGGVVAIHFADPTAEPLRLSEEHYESLRRALPSPVTHT